jgi:hypothetical protein
VQSPVHRRQRSPDPASRAGRSVGAMERKSVCPASRTCSSASRAPRPEADAAPTSADFSYATQWVGLDRSRSFVGTVHAASAGITPFARQRKLLAPFLCPRVRDNMAMRLLRRQWGGEVPPIAFPAWRVWEDKRVRADNNVLALFAAARIAKSSVSERAQAAGDSRLLVVGDLYSDEELPYRAGFRLRLDEALSRWDNGMEDLSRMAIVVGVATMDELLGAVIRLLRATDHDSTIAGTVDTGVSTKLSHLSQHGQLEIDLDTRALHQLLIEVRHAVTHYAALQRPVREAWDRLSDEARDWWTDAAGQALPLTSDAEELRVGDHELLGALKTLDRVGVEVSAGLQRVVTEAQWADLMVGEYRQLNLATANDPSSNVRRILTFSRSIWRFQLDRDLASVALSRSTPPEYVPLLQPSGS